MSKDEIRIITKNGEIITADSPIWRWEISEKIGHSGVNLEDPNVSEVEKEKFVKSIHDIAISYNIEPDELLKAVKIVAKESQHVAWFGCSPSRHAAFVPISESILEKEKAKAQKIKDLSNKANEEFTSAKYEEARETINEAYNLDPSNKDIGSFKANINLELLKISIQKGKEQKDKTETLNREGDKKYNAKNYKAALEDYEKAISISTVARLLKKYHVNKAHALNKLNQDDEAIRAAEEALKIDPNYEYAKNSIGVIKFKAGKYEEALKYFEDAITLNPKNAQQYSNKAHALIKLNRYEEAKTASEKALEIDQKNKNAQEHLAEAQKGIEVEKIKAEAEKFNLEGDKKFEIKDYEGALNDYKNAILKNPTNALYFAKKANTLVQLGKNDEALETVKEALKIDAKLQYAIDVQNLIDAALKLENERQEQLELDSLSMIEEIRKNVDESFDGLEQDITGYTNHAEF